MYELRPYQTEAIVAINEHWQDWQRELLVLPTGCHEPNQGILMFDGSVKKAKDIRLGDELMSPTGEPRTVLHLHHGKDEMYEVRPVKGKSFIVSSDHILPLMRTNECSNPQYPSEALGGTVDMVTVKNWCKKSRNWKHIHKIYRSSGIDRFGTRSQILDSDIEPYFLGLLLGDGGIKNSICITTEDSEIRSYIESISDKYGFTFREEKTGNADTIYLKSGELGCKGSRLHQQLKALGLRGTTCRSKFIPNKYKYADKKDRLKILAGLIDTDGHYVCGGYDYISKSKTLSEDVAFICRSCGLAAYVRKCVKTSQNRTSGIYWRVSISGDCSIIPCRIKRKMARKRLQKKDVLRTGVKSIECVGSGEYFGFTVDGDNLYLLDDFTVTHNCGKTVVFNEIARQKAPGVLILAHRDELIEQARQKFGGDTGKIKADENSILPVTVGSVQTMCRRTYAPDLFSTIIVDEAHHAVSPSYQTILRQFPDAKVLGVTATADRADKKNLGQYFDGIAYQYSLKRAVEEGWLCNISARTVPIDIDFSNVKVSVGDFEVNSIAETLEPYLPEIAKAIAEYAADRKTVVFLPLVSIAKEFRDILESVGLDAREVNGQSIDRKEILEWFDKAGPGSVLCNAMLLTEGWDCPSVDCVVVLRPTKVRALYTQMIGRGTRLSPGKKDLLILDFLWLCQKHNLCKPAHLVTDQVEDQQTVAKRSETEEIDLFDALTDAEEQRKNRLAEELRKQKKKKSKLINPLELFSLLDDIGLADYEPSFKWEEADASQKQIAALEKFGIDAEGITKGYACRIMDTVIGRSKKGLATMKQVRLLNRFGYDAAKMTMDEATKKINRLAAVNWQRWKLRD